MNNYYEVCTVLWRAELYPCILCFNFNTSVKTKQFSFSFHLFLCYWKDLHLPFPWWRSRNDGLSIKNNQKAQLKDSKHTENNGSFCDDVWRWAFCIHDEYFLKREFKVTSLHIKDNRILWHSVKYTRFL